MTEEVKAEEEIKLIKLDLGSGQSKKAPEYIGVDFDAASGCDVVHDLTKGPWPWEDSSVDEIHSSHFFEHLTGKERILFMNESYRILKPGKQMVVITPFWTSMRAYGDPTHQWPPICEMTFMYYNKDWRVTNKLTHGDYAAIIADFDFGYNHGIAPDTDIASRNEEFKINSVRHKVNAVWDFYVTLTSKKV